jgi:hypothetical protein
MDQQIPILILHFNIAHPVDRFLLLNFMKGLFLPHPLEGSLFVDIEFKSFNALQLILKLLVVGLLVQILAHVTLDPLVKFLVDQIHSIDAVKLIDGDDEALVDKFLDNFDLHLFVLLVNFEKHVVDRVHVLEVVDPAHQNLALLHQLVDLLAHEGQVVLVHHVEGHLHHYLLYQPAVQPFQTAVGLLYVQKLLETLLVRLLDVVMEDLRVGFVLGEKVVVLLDFLGVEGAFGFDDVQEDFLDLQIVLLGRQRGTKERFM